MQIMFHFPQTVQGVYKNNIMDMESENSDEDLLDPPAIADTPYMAILLFSDCKTYTSCTLLMHTRGIWIRTWAPGTSIEYRKCTLSTSEPLRGVGRDVLSSNF